MTAGTGVTVVTVATAVVTVTVMRTVMVVAVVIVVTRQKCCAGRDSSDSGGMWHVVGRRSGNLLANSMPPLRVSCCVWL
jgi:hypothetical protein